MLDFLFTPPLPYPACFITIAIGGRTEKKLYSQHLVTFMSTKYSMLFVRSVVERK